MRNIAYLFAFIPFLALSSVDMTRIKTELFIHEPLTDLDRITESNTELKRTLVSYLFEQDLLNHEGTKAFATDAKFDTYYAVYASRYRLIDLDHDGNPELVFNGFVSKDDDRERVEIYLTKNAVPKKIYDEMGHIPAYKIQPNTQEILLIHHQYPCCQNASHNLDRLRLVEGKIQRLRRYFVAREAPDMKGTYFPGKSTFTKNYYRTTKPVALRWSGAVISEDAWSRRTPENIVVHYDSLSVYRILAEEKGWYFVLMHSPPMLNDKGRVVNAANLQETAVYGWLEKRRL
jgi:hypothetical protein